MIHICLELHLIQDFPILLFARVIEPLIEQKIIKEKALGKQIRIFSLNMDCDITKYLLKIHADLKTMMNNSSDMK